MSATPTPAENRDQLKRAIRTIRRLQEHVDLLEKGAREPIAIIGLGCRFPGGVTDPEGFWRLLEEGRDGITEVPASRWDPAAYYDPNPAVAGKMYTLAGGFVDHIDRFDAELFNISPREAAKIDPQHRLLLEVAWEALEHAGLPPRGLSETRTGVFVGITAFEYGQQLSQADAADIDVYSMTGTKLNFAAGRLSYLLGLQGPAMAIDTACSSSLVALHVACRSLRAGDCDLALVGGVNAMLTPEQTIGECKARMLSPRGRCRTFDAGADGFVRGEGCGVVVVKRLRDAQQQGDPIAAVILGSAVNQDGASSGLTVPNRLAQEAVIRAALVDAGLDAADIDYVEAHGTGTPLGDPIEVRALANVFGVGRQREAPLKIGAVKTNVGHLESASGVAGVLKVVLSLRHEAVPPHLHLQQLNPAVDWADIPIEVPTKLLPWPMQGRRRRAGVSSFGASGTNAHLIIEEGPNLGRPEEFTERPVHVLALSARTDEALINLTGRFATALESLPSDRLADVCYTAAVGRSHQPHRLAMPVDSIDSARSALAAIHDGQDIASKIVATATARAPRVAFLFSGQGAQYASMGRQLYQSQPTFRRLLDECGELLAPHLDRPLLDVLFEECGNGNLIHRTAYTQPALFALEYAMARLWMSWGVLPAAMLGHSVGEYAAACVGGLIDLPSALRLVAARGRLMESLPTGGAMAAVFAPAQVVADAIRQRREISIAAVNGPASVVVSGDADAIDDILRELEADGVESRSLQVSHAFHSSRMEPILDELETLSGDLLTSSPTVPIVSNLTGGLVGAAEIGDSSYWRRHARNAVQFEQGMRTLEKLGVDAFLEVGPSPTLLGMGSQCLPDHPGPWLPSLRPGRGDWQQVAESLGSLYVRGAPIDWEAFDSDYPRQKQRLPTYPFARKRHWIDLPTSPPSVSTGTVDRNSQSAPEHPLLGTRLPSPLAAIQYETRLNLDAIGWLDDHRVFATPVVPAAAFVEMALAAAEPIVGRNVVLEDVFLHAAIAIQPGESKTAQLILEPLGDAASFRILTLRQGGAKADEWMLHVSGRIQPRDPAADDPQSEPSCDEIKALEKRCGEEVSVNDHYRGLAVAGVDMGPTFRTVERLRRGDAEAVGWVRLSDAAAADSQAYMLHPALLDGCLQVAGGALPTDAQEGDSAPLIPLRFARLRLYKPYAGRLISHVLLRAAPDTLESGTPGTYEVDLRVTDEDQYPVVEIDGLRLVRADRRAFARPTDAANDDSLYELSWRAKPLAPGPTTETTAQWLLLGQGDQLTNVMAERLRQAGERVWTVRPADHLHIAEDGVGGVRPHVREDFDRLIEQTVGRHPEPWVVVHAWGTGLGNLVPSAESLQACHATLCPGLLHLTQAVERQAPDEVVRLVVVTCAAQGPDPSWTGLLQAPLWGLGRVVMTEQPRLRCLLVDTEHSDATAAEQIITEVRSPDEENQILYRGGRRQVARLTKCRRQPSQDVALDRPGQADRHLKPQRLLLENPGLPDSLRLRQFSRCVPGPGEVEIKVEAAGLNFRDVLVALAVYQGEAGPLGGECAGRVVAVGPDVSRFAPGDEVVAFAAGSFASHVVARAELTWHKPMNLSFEQAAAIPIAFLTAAYCLEHLGQMSNGDRVLIHCAAGGVGMAAVQLARRAGAEVFGTAGSADKRALISARGVSHVMSSRSLDFANEAMAITQGRGLDIVLNSLAGEFIDRGLAIVRDGGRFLEIGRTDIWSAEQVKKARDKVAYFPVLLGDVSDENPALIQSIGAEIMTALETGQLEPLPVTSFPMVQAADAFRLMAQAKHTGKLVLTAAPSTSSVRAGTSPVSAERTYLVTGGYGGLGLQVARWLIDKGAGHVALMGRSGGGGSAMEVIEALRQSGAEISALYGDVTREEDVRRVLDQIDSLEWPLGGIIHAAGVVDDGVLSEQSVERLEQVLAAKVTGSWLLHELTRDCTLDLFVLFSSASSLFGSAGQGSYAAANAFLDALAHWRRARGLVGLSMNWGPWAEAGMFVESGQAGQRTVTERGFRPMSTQLCLSALQRGLEAQRGQLGAFLVDWSDYQAKNTNGNLPLLVAELIATPHSSEDTLQRDRFKAELAAAPSKRRAAILQQQLRVEIAQVLGSDPATVSKTQGFRELGMDSLMAVELRNRLAQLLDCSLVSTLAFDHPNLESLAKYLLGSMRTTFPDRDSAAAVRVDGAPVAVSQPEVKIDDLRALSDEEAEHLLIAELEGIPEEEQDG